MRIQASPSCPPRDPSKDTFPTLSAGTFFHPPSSATGLISLRDGDGEPRELLPKRGTALTTVRRAPFLKQGWKAMSWGCAPRSPRRKPLAGKGKKTGLQHDCGAALGHSGKTQRFQGRLWLNGDVWVPPGCTRQGQPEAKGF